MVSGSTYLALGRILCSRCSPDGVRVLASIKHSQEKSF